MDNMSGHLSRPSAKGASPSEPAKPPVPQRHLNRLGKLDVSNPYGNGKPSTKNMVGNDKSRY
jgi:hypothetical protein